MKSLLAFYDIVDLDTAAIHAATLEEVTYAKVMKTGAKQAAGSVVRGANTLFRWAGSRHTIDIEPQKKTAELVVERSEHWKRSSADIVRNQVLGLLRTRLAIKNDDLGALSRRVVEEAAAEFNIPEDLLLSQQAELIADAYLKECLKGLQEHLKKQGESEARETENTLSESIAGMTPAQKVEIQKALGIRDLSGRSLRESVLKTGIPLAGIAAVQASGFGAYLALTTVMHAVFTSMLGITLPFAAYTTATSALSLFTGPLGIVLSLGVAALGALWGQRKIERNQCAMIVFACVSKAGWHLVPKTAELPSFQHFRLLSDGRDMVIRAPTAGKQEHADLLDSKVASEQGELFLQKANAERDLEKRRREAVEKRLLVAQQQLAAARDKIAHSEAAQSTLESSLGSLIVRIEQHKSDIAKAQASLVLKNAEVGRAERAARSAKESYHGKLEKSKKELRAIWEVRYRCISFESQPLAWAAELPFEARLEVERALCELADADDPVQLSRSKMHSSGEHHSGFTIPEGVPCRMFYTANGKSVTIRRICKRKDC